MNYSRAKLIGTKAQVRQAVSKQDLYDALDVIVNDERFTESQVNLYQDRIESELALRARVQKLAD